MAMCKVNEKWQKILETIPPVPLRYIEVKDSLNRQTSTMIPVWKQTISPAKSWERINNIETPQLYPVFPWRIYGVGKENLEIARDTYFYDPDALKFRSHTGWKQDNIWAACLGLTEEAKSLSLAKLSDGPHRFPAFWGPGYDWTPDHNWGGSGMIGLQEMLLQTNGAQILLFPAWPKEWNVHFKLHAPGNTTVEATLKDGKVTDLKVSPENRKKDIKLKSTSAGPHRDDILFFNKDINIRTYGSQGQKRTVALSLKLAEIELVKSLINDTPVLLLDDVLSELDSDRQNHLLKSLDEIQTVITCTGLDEFIENRFSINKVFQVTKGKIEERTV